MSSLTIALLLAYLSVKMSLRAAATLAAERRTSYPDPTPSEYAHASERGISEALLIGQRDSPTMEPDVVLEVSEPEPAGRCLLHTREPVDVDCRTSSPSSESFKVYEHDAQSPCLAYPPSTVLPFS